MRDDDYLVGVMVSMSNYHPRGPDNHVTVTTNSRKPLSKKLTKLGMKPGSVTWEVP